jgi:hypothetical protein
MHNPQSTICDDDRKAVDANDKDINAIRPSTCEKSIKYLPFLYIRSCSYKISFAGDKQDSSVSHNPHSYLAH